MAKRNTTRDVMVIRVRVRVRACIYEKWDDVMIHHMTKRCALISKVEPLLCYGQERCFALKAWFVLVIYVCMHSSSKVCI